jgi:hypothetical protein
MNRVKRFLKKVFVLATAYFAAKTLIETARGVDSIDFAQAAPGNKSGGTGDG